MTPVAVYSLFNGSWSCAFDFKYVNMFINCEVDCNITSYTNRVRTC